MNLKTLEIVQRLADWVCL